MHSLWAEGAPGPGTQKLSYGVTLLSSWKSKTLLSDTWLCSLLSLPVACGQLHRAGEEGALGVGLPVSGLALQCETEDDRLPPWSHTCLGTPASSRSHGLQLAAGGMGAGEHGELAKGRESGVSERSLLGAPLLL